MTVFSPISYNANLKVWEVRSYKLASRLLKQGDTFTSNYVPFLREHVPEDRLAEFEPLLKFLEMQILSLDGPQHKELHRQFFPFFSPAKVELLRPIIQTRAQSLIQEALAGVERSANKIWDVVSTLAVPLPLQTLMVVMGLPIEDAMMLKAWGTLMEECFVGFTDDIMTKLEKAMEAMQQFSEYLARVGSSCIEDSIVGTWWKRCEAGEMDRESMVANVLFMIGAGHETTTSLISGLILSLVVNPDQFAELMKDQSLIPKYLDEAARFSTPVKRILRRVLPREEPLTIKLEPEEATGDSPGSVTLQAGDFVHFVLGVPQTREQGAHTDPEVFNEPMKFDPSRPEAKKNLSFGAGAHSCVGVRLAKVEAQVVLETLMENLKNHSLSLAFDPSALSWEPTGTISALTTLPLQIVAPNQSIAATEPIAMKEPIAVKPQPEPVPTTLGNGVRSSKIPAGKSIPRGSDDGRQCWSPVPPSNFNLRIGPNYAKHGKKAPAQAQILEVVGVDVFSCPQKIGNVLKFIDTPVVDYAVKHWFVISCHMPGYAPGNPLWGSKVDDGEGYVVVAYCPITPETWHRMENAKGGGWKLFYDYLHAHQSPKPEALYDRMKLIGKIANLGSPDLKFGTTLNKLLDSYNAKPVLTRPQHKIYPQNDRTVVDVDVHQFSYIARKGVHGFLPTLKNILFDLCFVMEAHTDDELPEVVLSSVRLCRLNPELVKPWPGTQEAKQSQTDNLGDRVSPGAGTPAFAFA